MSAKYISEEHGGYRLNFSMREASLSKLYDCHVEVASGNTALYRLSTFNEHSPDAAVDRLRRHALRWLQAKNVVLTTGATRLPIATETPQSSSEPDEPV